MSDTRQEKLEARAAVGRLVEEISAVRPRIRARDRQAEAGSVGVVAALEAVEESRAQIFGNARSAILDGDAHVTVALLRGNDDRRPTVTHRVDEQVGHDAVEHE